MKLRQTLFWDTNPDKIDLEKNAQYIIERILDFGHDDEIRWMNEYYPTKVIGKILKNSRTLLPHTRSFWGPIYNVESIWGLQDWRYTSPQDWAPWGK